MTISFWVYSQPIRRGGCQLRSVTQRSLDFSGQYTHFKKHNLYFKGKILTQDLSNLLGESINHKGFL